MYFNLYDYISGNLIASNNNIDFGKILQGQHCVHPIILKAFQDQETNVSNLKIYLENKGSWQSSDFGYYISPTFVSGLESGNMVDHFTEVKDASSSSPNGISIGWDSTSSYYMWLDVNVSPDKRGINSANYRFFFDHS